MLFVMGYIYFGIEAALEMDLSGIKFPDKIAKGSLTFWCVYVCKGGNDELTLIGPFT